MRDKSIVDSSESDADTTRDVLTQVTTARNALPAIRVSARREAQQRIDALTAAQQRADTGREHARQAAQAAATAARDAGAPQPQWANLLARAENHAALATELQQAQLADDSDEEIRRHTTERATRAADGTAESAH